MSIFSHHSPSSSKPRRWQQGFTLIELLAVMSIMLIVTTAMLVRQSRFDSSTVLRSLAYSVALSMRQAQVYGTSVLGTTAASSAACGSGFYNTTTGTCYASAYGLYFNSTTPSQYILFADLNSNGKYDSGENIKVFTLSSGYVISQICANGSTNRCSPSTITSISVVFKRPNPDAQIIALDGSGNPIAGDVYSNANIQVQHTDDPTNTRSATVSNTGLISAQ